MEDLTIRHGEERLDLVPSDAFDGKGARLAVLEPGEECSIYLGPDDLRRVARWALDRVDEVDPAEATEWGPLTSTGDLVYALRYMDRTAGLLPVGWTRAVVREALRRLDPPPPVVPQDVDDDREVLLELEAVPKRQPVRWIIPTHREPEPMPGTIVRCGPAGAVWRLGEWWRTPEQPDAIVAVLEPVDPHDVGPLEDVPELFLPLGEWKSPPAAPADVPGARS